MKNYLLYVKSFHLQTIREAERLQEESRRLRFYARRLIFELEKHCDALDNDQLDSARELKEAFSNESAQ
ncbi:MAG TPA: hypothetical protein VF599_02535 [Pyrinomonadaceae bacterium]|jgi:hypothetical protein